MAVKAVVQSNFEGGMSHDPRLGTKHSFAYGQALDFRKTPGQMSVLPGAAKESGSTVTDLVVNAVMDQYGAIWEYGNTGKVYKRTTAAAYSLYGTTTTAAMGMSYRQDMDAIFLAGTKTMHRLYGFASGTPTLTSDYYATSYSTYNNTTNAGFNVNAYQTGSVNTTTVNTTIITEASTSQRFFQTDIEPISKISVWITIAGTGTWTLTLHDGENNTLGTATLDATSVAAGAFNDFVFANQIRVYPSPNARTYHIHLTKTGVFGVVASSSNNDLSTADLRVYADRLINTNNGMHPMIRFQQYECIGNGNYLSVWEPISATPTNSEWYRHKLTFPSEYEVCGLTIQNEFLVIACERKTTSTTQVPQQGILFFWDGLSSTYNYFLPIPEGSPYSIATYKNVIYYQAGGDWFGVASPSLLPVKIRRMPGVDTEYTNTQAVTAGYPQMMTVRNGILMMGFPSATTATTIPAGVYSWGSVDKNFPNAIGYSYVISTGTQYYSGANNLQIGMVKSFGNTLLISWRDTANYGVDRVDSNSSPAGTAIYRSLVFDNEYTGKEKTGLYIECYFVIPAGATLQLGYAMNSAIDSATFTVDPNAYSSTNLYLGQSGYARFYLDRGRFREIQSQLTITSTSNTTAPVIHMVALVFDDNSSEMLM